MFVYCRVSWRWEGLAGTGLKLLYAMFVCVCPVFAVVRPDDVIHVQSVVFNHSRGIFWLIRRIWDNLAGWGPPVISWFMTPSKYSYLRIIHQLVTIVINQLTAIPNWGPILGYSQCRPRKLGMWIQGTLQWVTLWWTNIAMERSTHFSWENPLFLWPFSIAMLVHQRVIHPSFFSGSTRSLSHVNHWSYNPVTSRGMSHQVRPSSINGGYCIAINGNSRILKWRYCMVLYHIRPYFRGISPYIGLKNRPYIWNRYLHQLDPEIPIGCHAWLVFSRPPVIKKMVIVNKWVGQVLRHSSEISQKTMERSTILNWLNQQFRLGHGFHVAFCYVYQRVYPINIPLNHYNIPLNHYKSH